MTGTDLDTLRGVVVRHFPELRDGSFVLLGQGWDCVAVDVDDRLIFKFPRHAAAAKGLLKLLHPGCVAAPSPPFVVIPGDAQRRPGTHRPPRCSPLPAPVPPWVPALRDCVAPAGMTTSWGKPGKGRPAR